MSKLCKNGTLVKNGIDNVFICNETNYICGHIRWCTTDKCIKMTSGYKDCERKYDMNKKEILDANEIVQDEELVEGVKLEEVKEVNPKQIKKKSSIKTKKCKIILNRKNNALVDFNGSGIIVPNKKGLEAGDIIDVKYIGTIGKKDFKILEK